MDRQFCLQQIPLFRIADIRDGRAWAMIEINKEHMLQGTHVSLQQYHFDRGDSITIGMVLRKN